MAKFIRNYRLTIEVDEGEAIIIESPLTIEFNIVRNTMSSVNSMNLNIYNLKPETRSRIFQDRFNPKEYKRIILQAGYENLSTVFIGNIFMASSYITDNKNIVTNIDARDGGFDTSGTLTNGSIEGGTLEDVIKFLAGDFEHITVGEIGGEKKTFNKPLVLSGNTFKLIKKYTDGQAFVDLEELKVLSNNEVIEGQVTLIDSSTGLLETPRRNDAYLTVKTLFEPSIVMGQYVEIKSDVAPIFDGQYKVIGVSHNGTISGAVSGECTSEFNLLVGSQLFGGFNIVK